VGKFRENISMKANDFLARFCNAKEDLALCVAGLSVGYNKNCRSMTAVKGTNNTAATVFKNVGLSDEQMNRCR